MKKMLVLTLARTVAASVAAGAFAIVMSIGATTSASATALEPNLNSTVESAADSTFYAMVPDCDHFSASARAYATTHNIDVCGVGSSTLSTAYETAEQQERISGDCGSSELYVGNKGSGNMFIRWGFNSSVGPVNAYNLVIDYAGWVNDGSFPDSGLMLGNDHARSSTVHVGAGTAGAELFGTVSIWWGLTCNMAGPSDDANIT